jgi:hypothetical protein
MARATKQKTTADLLRSVKRARRDDLSDLLDDLRQIRDDFETGAEALDDASIDSDPLYAMLQHHDPDLANEFELAAAAWNMLVAGVEGPFQEFVEQYDETQSALESFESLMETDSYPGIGDDRREAWDEVEACLDLLADTLDGLGIDLNAVTTEGED